MHSFDKIITPVYTSNYLNCLCHWIDRPTDRQTDGQTDKKEKKFNELDFHLFINHFLMSQVGENYWNTALNTQPHLGAFCVFKWCTDRKHPQPSIHQAQSSQRKDGTWFKRQKNIGVQVYLCISNYGGAKKKAVGIFIVTDDICLWCKQMSAIKIWIIVRFELYLLWNHNRKNYVHNLSPCVNC